MMTVMWNWQLVKVGRSLKPSLEFRCTTPESRRAQHPWWPSCWYRNVGWRTSRTDTAGTWWGTGRAGREAPTGSSWCEPGCSAWSAVPRGSSPPSAGSRCCWPNRWSRRTRGGWAWTGRDTSTWLGGRRTASWWPALRRIWGWWRHDDVTKIFIEVRTDHEDDDGVLPVETVHVVVVHPELDLADRHYRLQQSFHHLGGWCLLCK